MLDLSFQQLLLRAGSVLLLSLIHGLTLVLICRWLGDKGPQYDGRLTWNPFQHIDLVGAAALMLFSYGWIRPIRLDDQADFIRRIVLVFGSLLLTLLIVLSLGLLSPLIGALFPGTGAATVLAFLRSVTDETAGLVALNWLPVLPLTGGLLTPALSPSVAGWLRRHQVLVTFSLFALVVSGLAGVALDPLRLALARLLLLPFGQS